VLAEQYIVIGVAGREIGDGRGVREARR